MPAAVRDTVPPAALYRIGRAPDPLAWPPPGLAAGNNRFDDPAGQFAVFYAAEQRLTCFIETLARYRLALEWVAAVGPTAGGLGGHASPGPARVPADWREKRRLGRFRLAAGQRGLDLRALETRIALRGALAAELTARSLADFDLGDAVSRDRTVTQTVARWAYEAGFNDIAYTSRFGCDYDCWAIFDRAHVLRDETEALATDDLDLIEVARLFDLVIPSAGHRSSG
jgi:hypothetical protein